MITRVEQRFSVKRRPDEVFDYIAELSNAPAWQPARITVELLTAGPVKTGTRIRERGKALGIIPVEQISEVTRFDRPSCIEVTVLEGPVTPVVGSYTFEPEGDGTCVRAVHEFGATGMTERILVPLTRRLVARRLARYNRRLVHVLEGDRHVSRCHYP